MQCLFMTQMFKENPGGSEQPKRERRAHGSNTEPSIDDAWAGDDSSKGTGGLRQQTETKRNCRYIYCKEAFTLSSIGNFSISLLYVESTSFPFRHALIAGSLTEMALWKDAASY